MSACSTKQVIQTREVHDTVRMVAVQHDSVFMHDSVYVREYRQNDTVYVTQWKERWREHSRSATGSHGLTTMSSLKRPVPPLSDFEQSSHRYPICNDRTLVWSKS